MTRQQFENLCMLVSGIVAVGVALALGAVVVVTIKGQPKPCPHCLGTGVDTEVRP